MGGTIGKGRRLEKEGGRGGRREGGRYLVVEGEALVSVLHELVDREHGVVGLYDRVRHLEGGKEGGTEGGRED